MYNLKRKIPALGLVFFRVDNILQVWYNSTKFTGIMRMKYVIPCSKKENIMDLPDTKTLLEYAGAGSAGLFGLALMGQKFLNLFKTDKAENTILTLMHSELERMSEQNTSLSIELGKLQDELMTLNRQLRVLTTENERLNNEVTVLTSEVSRLQNILHIRK